MLLFAAIKLLQFIAAKLFVCFWFIFNLLLLKSTYLSKSVPSICLIQFYMGSWD